MLLAAQFTIDDVELVVVLLDSSFESTAMEQKTARLSELQAAAARAGLAGQVVLVWQDAQGRTRFFAPREQHAFFQIVNYRQLLAQANRTLECG